MDRSVPAPFPDFRNRALDGERVLVLLRGSARGKTSGVELGRVRTKAAALFHFRGDTVTRLVVYFDRERALADLGLSEQDAHHRLPVLKKRRPIPKSRLNSGN